MAYPDIIGATGGGTTANATGTDINIPNPVGSAAGDLLVAVVTVDQNTGSAFAWPATPAFTSFLTKDIGTAIRQEGRYRIATATEGTSFRIGHVTNMSSHIVARIAAGTFDPATAPEATTASGSVTTAPNPPNLAWSWGSAETLVMAFGSHDDGTTTFTATGTAPPSYTAVTQKRGNSTQGTGIALAERDVSATGENPGAFGLSTTETVIGTTVAIRPSAAVAAGPTFDHYYRNMRAG